MPASHRSVLPPARSGLYLIKAFFLASLLLLPAPHARAQGYTIQNPDNGGYSGGTNSGQVFLPPPFSYSMSYGYSNGTYGGGSWTYDPGSTASCSGAITTTFTWVPPDSDPSQPPPKSAIVVESCTASAFSGDGMTGSCSTGFSGDGQSSSTGGVSGTQYTGHSDPGASFTVQDTPSASSTPSSNHLGNVSLSYSASASPITIQPSGTTPDGSGGEDILVGQHCTASLSGIPDVLLNSATKPTYSWSVSGTTFQTWSADTPAVGGSSYNQDASYYVDGPGPLTNPTAGWYWNDLQQTPETVSCTATVTPPAGQGSPFTVTATKKVTVMVPGWTAFGTGGNMQVNTASPGSSGSAYWLWAGPTAGSGAVGGMDWRATVSSPNPALFGDGSIELVQLIIPNLSYNALNNFGVSSTYTWSLNGQEGLDTDYPYPWLQGAPSYFTNDNPGMSLDNKTLSATVKDQFEDYIMYFAPGSVQPVPLAHFVWSTDGNATKPNPGGWAAFGSGSAGSVSPSGAPVKFSKNNSFPMWTQNSGNDAGGYF